MNLILLLSNLFIVLNSFFTMETPSYKMLNTFDAGASLKQIQYSPDFSGFLWSTYNYNQCLYYRNFQTFLENRNGQKVCLFSGSGMFPIDKFVFCSTSGRILVISQTKNESNVEKRYFIWLTLQNGVLLQSFTQSEMSQFVTDQIDEVIVNKQLLVALTSGNKLGVFNSSGILISEVKFENLSKISMRWHPLNQNLILIGEMPQKNKTIGYFGYYMIRQKMTFMVNQYRTLALAMTRDGQIAFQSSVERGLEAYQVSQDYTFKPLGQLITEQKGYDRIRISDDGNLLFLDKRSEPQLFQIYKIIRKNASEGLIKPQNQQVSRQDTELFEHKNTEQKQAETISLQLVFNKSMMHFSLTSISMDGNQFQIATVYDSFTTVTRNGICPDEVYLTNLTCQPCSSVCRTCSHNSTTCTSCKTQNFTITLFNSTCLSCSSVITGCLTCKDAYHCISCDFMGKFELINDKCVCQEYYFLDNQTNACIPCDDRRICKRCTSHSNCYQCNSQSHWEENINGTCICENYYFQANDTCVSCDPDQACVKCYSDEKCILCNDLNNWNSTPVNGKCVCQNKYKSFNGTCIYCPITGCSYCKAFNTCTKCLEEFNFIMSGENCVCKQNYQLDPNQNICVPINEKEDLLVWLYALLSLIFLIFFYQCSKKVIKVLQQNRKKEARVLPEYGRKGDQCIFRLERRLLEDEEFVERGETDSLNQIGQSSRGVQPDDAPETSQSFKQPTSENQSQRQINVSPQNSIISRITKNIAQD